MAINREVRMLRIVDVSVSRSAGTHRMLIGYLIAWLQTTARRSQGHQKSYTQRHRRSEQKLSGGTFAAMKRAGDPLVADVATLRMGPFASMPPFAIVRLGQSLYGNEFHI